MLQQTANQVLLHPSPNGEVGSIETETKDLICRLSTRPDNYRLKKREITTLAECRRSPNRKGAYLAFLVLKRKGNEIDL